MDSRSNKNIIISKIFKFPKDLSYIPLLLFIVSIIFSHISGNDKAPFLVISTGIISIFMGIYYTITSLLNGLFLKKIISIILSFIPICFLLIVFILSRYNLIDTFFILGFR